MLLFSQSFALANQQIIQEQPEENYFSELDNEQNDVVEKSEDSINKTEQIEKAVPKTVTDNNAKKSFSKKEIKESRTIEILSPDENAVFDMNDNSSIEVAIKGNNFIDQVDAVNVDILNANGSSIANVSFVPSESSFDKTVSIPINNKKMNSGNYIVKAWVSSDNGNAYSTSKGITILFPTYLTQDSKSVVIGETMNYPLANVNDKTFSYSVNNDIAKVSAAGMITAYKPGVIYISAKSGDEEYSFKLTVKKPSFKKSTVSMYIKKSSTQKLINSPKKVSWSSSNKKVAKVDSKGKVVSIKRGTCYIKATAYGTVYKYKLVVKNPSIAYASKKPSTKYHCYFKLKVLGKGKSVKWKSSNKKVATVSKSGKVFCKKKGTVVIFAKTSGVTVKKKIKIKANSYSNPGYSTTMYYEDYGMPEIAFKSVKYKNNKMYVTIAVLNNRVFYAKKFTKLTINLYSDVNGAVIAKKRFKNIKLNIPAYGVKKLKLVIPYKNIKQKNVDLKLSDPNLRYNYFYIYEY